MLTGKYYIKEKLLGGFNVFVEDKHTHTRDIDDPKMYYSYRKANLQDLIYIGLPLDGSTKKKRRLS